MLNDKAALAERGIHVRVRGSLAAARASHRRLGKRDAVAGDGDVRAGLIGRLADRSGGGTVAVRRRRE
jgi:hypothetical protein